jgi:hypothetical protein
MRVISMHKVDAAMEAGARPSKELIQGMGRLIGEMRRDRAFLDGDGLLPSATRVRLRFSGGERTLQKGPYAGANELVAGIAMMKVRDMDEAIGWASRYGEAVGDAELELGPVTEAWDLGLMPKPADAPLRCLLLHKADADSEAGRPIGKAAASALARVTDEMTKAGVLLTAERFQPSSKGARMKVTAKRATVVDGPFAESKELIAGFVLLEVPSIQRACEWGTRFADVIGDVELDILPLYDAPAS